MSMRLSRNYVANPKNPENSNQKNHQPPATHHNNNNNNNKLYNDNYNNYCHNKQTKTTTKGSCALNCMR